PRQADARAGIVDLPDVGVGAEADRALRVADVGADLVAALQVQLAAGRNRPAHLVGRVAVDDVVGPVVGAAGVVHRTADADEAPSLVHAQVGDDVRIAEAVGGGVLRLEGVVGSDDAVQGKAPGR